MVLSNACITKHAIERFQQRREKETDQESRDNILMMFEGAEPFEPEPEYKVKSLMKHGFREVFYYHAHGWIMVVVNENLTTMFPHDARKPLLWKYT